MCRNHFLIFFRYNMCFRVFLCVAPHRPNYVLSCSLTIKLTSLVLKKKEALQIPSLLLAIIFFPVSSFTNLQVNLLSALMPSVAAFASPLLVCTKSIEVEFWKKDHQTRISLSLSSELTSHEMAAFGKFFLIARTILSNKARISWPAKVPFSWVLAP